MSVSHPMGSTLFTRGIASVPPSLQVRQVSTGTDREIVAPIANGSFAGTTFSPDSELVYYNYYHPEARPLGTLYQIPVIGGREPKKILEHLIWIIGFAPDGKQFAMARGTFSADIVLIKGFR